MLAPVALLARRIVTEANPALHAAARPAHAGALHALGLADRGRRASTSPGRSDHVRPADRPPAARGRARRPSRPAAPTRCCSAARSSTCSAARRARRPARRAGARGRAATLERAFHGRPRRHTEGTWRAHLQRMAEGRLAPPSERLGAQLTTAAASTSAERVTTTSSQRERRAPTPGEARARAAARRSIGVREDVAGEVGARGGDQDVARAGGEEVGDVEAAGARPCSGRPPRAAARRSAPPRPGCAPSRP